MSATHLEDLELPNLTPNRLIMTDLDDIVVSGPVLEIVEGLEIAGDLGTFTSAVGGAMSVTGPVKVQGELTIAQDLTIVSLEGPGTRPLSANMDGKIVPGSPGIQQIFVQYSDAITIPADATAHYLFEDEGGPVRGSLKVPRIWWKPGKSLAFTIEFDWTKQVGIDSSLYFGVELQPMESFSDLLIEIPVFLAEDEGYGIDNGTVTLELEIEMTGWTDAEHVEFQSIYTLRNRIDSSMRCFRGIVPGILEHSGYEDAEDVALLRPFVRFSDASGTNSVTVQTASVLAHDLQPLTF